MRPVPALLRLGLLPLVAAACSHNPSPGVPSPQPAPAAAPPAAARAADPTPTPAPVPATASMPAASTAIDLSGSWSATVDFQGQSMAVDLTLTRGPNGYTGQGAPQGQTPAALTSLRVDGNHVVMSFAAPDGEAVFDGTLSTDRQAITGNISYQGQTFPFVARKRP